MNNYEMFFDQELQAFIEYLSEKLVETSNTALKIKLITKKFHDFAGADRTFFMCNINGIIDYHESLSEGIIAYDNILQNKQSSSIEWVKEILQSNEIISAFDNEKLSSKFPFLKNETNFHGNKAGLYIPYCNHSFIAGIFGFIIDNYESSHYMESLYLILAKLTGSVIYNLFTNSQKQINLSVLPANKEPDKTTNKTKFDSNKRLKRSSLILSDAGDISFDLYGIDIDDISARLKDPMLIKNLLLEFLNNFRQYPQKIKKKISEGNTEQASKDCHTLKGVSGNMSAVSVYNAAINLETALKNFCQHDTDIYLEKLIQEADMTFESIKQNIFHGPDHAAKSNLTAKKVPTSGLNNRNKILIVDDIAENRAILANIFKEEYIVYVSDNGLHALDLAKEFQPDIILLDIMMPDLDGYEVCRIIKSIESISDIPIIFITAMNEVEAERKGLDIGAVDYITKPFNVPIIKSRVNTHLRLREANKKLKMLYGLALDSSPLTGLPGNNSIASSIENALSENKKAGVLYCDLDNFKPYNDKYGFVNGDKVIMFTKSVLSNAIVDLKIADSFLGHIGGDDFVLLIPSHMMNETCQYIVKKFDEGIADFYNSEDIERGFIVSFNRQKKEEHFNLVSISIAGVNLYNTNFKSYLEVNDACADTKKKAKSIKGSSFFINRRNY